MSNKRDPMGPFEEVKIRRVDSGYIVTCRWSDQRVEENPHEDVCAGHDELMTYLSGMAWAPRERPI